MKTDHRWITVATCWKQMAFGLLFGIVVQASVWLPVESALAQELAEPPAKAVEPEKPDPVAADDEVSGQSTSPVASGPQVVYENSVETRWKVGAKVRTGSGRAVDVLSLIHI